MNTCWLCSVSTIQYKSFIKHHLTFDNFVNELTDRSFKMNDTIYNAKFMHSSYRKMGFVWKLNKIVYDLRNFAIMKLLCHLNYIEVK